MRLKSTAIIASAIFALGATASEAVAAPYVSGKYSIHLTGLCQTVWIDTGTDKSYLTGDFQQSVGYIKFTPTSAGSRHGSFSGKLTSVGGWINAPTSSPDYTYPANSRFATSTEALAGTYVMSDSTMTLTLGLETQIFTIYFTDPSTSQVIRNASFVRLIPGTAAGLPPTTPDCAQDGVINRE